MDRRKRCLGGPAHWHNRRLDHVRRCELHGLVRGLGCQSCCR